MLFALGFVSLFVIGGLSGIFLASPPVDMFVHDTYFVVAHIHYVLFGGSLFGIFAAILYWFPKMFGRMPNETLARLHFGLTYLAFQATFFPMHLLGLGGHMRPIYNPLQYDLLRPLQPIQVFITVSAICLTLAQMPFVVNVCWSLWGGKRAGANPWRANTLEWVAPSPPPHGNWGDALPRVYRGPYEFSAPDADEDYLPQARPPAAPLPGRLSASGPPRPLSLPRRPSRSHDER